MPLNVYTSRFSPPPPKVQTPTQSQSPAIRSILVIRRDNIGDLVCTTPLLTTLRQRFPDAFIAALVNSYNAPVLDGNPDVDAVYAYRKAKHRRPGESKVSVWLSTLSLLLKLRLRRFDVAIVAAPGGQSAALRLGRWVNARHLVGGQEGRSSADDDTHYEAEHEAELVMQQLRPLGLGPRPGPVRVFATRESAARVPCPTGEGPLIALHISARKPAQRWPVERFAELAHRLHQDYAARFLLFWSPGPADHPQHPGDDDKAALLRELCTDLPLLPCPTRELGELIAGLSRCSRMICSDGGAMHLAAGLGIPTLCFFGNSSARRWHPWGITYELLQPPTRNVIDISVDDARQAFARLENRLSIDALARSGEDGPAAR